MTCYAQSKHSVNNFDQTWVQAIKYKYVRAHSLKNQVNNQHGFGEHSVNPVQIPPISELAPEKVANHQEEGQ